MSEIKPFQPGPGLGGGLSKLLALAKAGVGVATGNPALIAGGVADLTPQSALGQMAGAAGTISSLSKALPSGDSSGGVGGVAKQIGEQFTQPELGDSSAMGRRMSLLSPEEHLDRGLQALDHPDVPDAVKQFTAPYLHGAKIFGGPHPKIDEYLNQGGGEES